MLNLPDKDPMPVNGLARPLDNNVATLYRWGSPRGVRGHRLHLTRIGGRTYVARSDWEAFCRALNGDAAPQSACDPSTHDRHNDLIDTELDAAGF